MESRPIHYISRLVSAAATVAGQHRLIEVLRSTVATAMELTEARYGAMGVLGPHGTLVDFLHMGMDEDVADSIGKLPEGRGVLGTITRAGVSLRLENIAEHPDSVGFPDHHPPMKTFLGVPVQVGTEIYGNLYLTEKAGSFTEEDEDLVSGLATIAGSAIATARLQERLRRVALVEDRERIARELHDSVIQDLFAVGLSLQSAANQVESQPAMVANRILESVDQLDESITTLRQYIFDIRQPDWPNRDLVMELSDLAVQLSAGNDQMRVTVAVDGDTDSVPGQLIDEATQFVKEGVSNALRHSRGTMVQVEVALTDHEMQIRVKDDGTGFDPNAVRKGMGLDNLHARADQIGGTARIITGNGQGTTVVAVLPIGDAD